MKTLIMDSATNRLYTALLEDEKIIYESYVEGKNDHAKAILVEVDKACKKANIELLELNQIIVGVGPGSYTGVRMAVTVGKMIATLDSQIKLYRISTLLLMASASKKRVLSCVDARRGNVFGCIYDFDKKSYLVEEGLIAKNELESNAFDCSVDENSFVVDPLKVVQMAEEVTEPRLLTPNYLRQTEAERNLNA